MHAIYDIEHKRILLFAFSIRSQLILFMAKFVHQYQPHLPTQRKIGHPILGTTAYNLSSYCPIPRHIRKRRAERTKMETGNDDEVIVRPPLLCSAGRLLFIHWFISRIIYIIFRTNNILINHGW